MSLVVALILNTAPVQLQAGWVVCMIKAKHVNRPIQPVQRVFVRTTGIDGSVVENTITFPFHKKNTVTMIPFPQTGPVTVESSATLTGQYKGRGRWHDMYYRSIPRNDSHIEYWFDLVKDRGGSRYGSLKVDFAPVQGACPTH
jgi:hypothetical protein